MRKNLFLIFALVTSTLMNTSCDFDDDFTEPDYVTLEFAPGNVPLGIEVGGSTSYDVNVYSAKNAETDRTYNISVDGTISPDAYTVPETVTIPAGSNEATFTVNASDIGLGVAGKTMVLNIEAEPDFSVGDPLSFSVARVCPGEEFVIALTLDSYPGETGYEILDSDGNSVVKVESSPAASRSLCLASGTYTFILRDSYGDGISDGGATLSYAGTVLATIDGDFGSETSVEVSF